MSSRKELKEIVNRSLLGLISDAFAFLQKHPGQKEKVMAIVDAMTEYRNRMIYRINHPSEKPEDTDLKRFYKGLTQELLAETGKLAEELSHLIKNVKKKGK